MSIQTVCDTTEYTAINIGKVCEVAKADNGKIFIQKALKATSCEVSVNSMAPGQAYPFFHSHKTHEEIYMCLGGEGEIQLNDEVHRFGEGDIVRVAPAVSRSVKNTGTAPLFFLCIQGQVNTMTDIQQDGNLEHTTPKFTK